MTYSLIEYLRKIEYNWEQGDGEYLSVLFTIKNPNLDFIDIIKLNTLDNQVSEIVSRPLDELVVEHLKVLIALSKKQFLDAYQHQSNVVQILVKILQGQKEENWMLPLMYAICLNLRLIAQVAEKHCGKPDKPNEILEKAAESLMSCFRVCAADNRTSDEDTKRLGMLAVVNQLFKVYFRINKLHLCKPLIRAIESSQFKDTFSLSQQITYKYFVGRKYIFDSNYESANEYLTFAFENCHKLSKKNKRLILIYLVPVKMLLGYMPSKTVLEKYEIMEFWQLTEAVKKGDLRSFDDVLQKHETFFISTGTYLIVEKLKILAYRNLFKKVWQILNTHQIPIEAFKTALDYVGQENVDLDETQCLLANLIYENRIKGYISHQHRKLVVSKQNPFPSIISQ